MATGVLDWPLAPVPSPLISAGPRVCLVAVDEYRRGVLAGRWLDLHAPLSVLRRQVEDLALAATDGSPLGLFDYEGVPGAVAAPVSISELRRRCVG